MVAAFPLVKLGLLLLKQLSKPVAKVIKNEAKKHPTVRKHVIIPIGKGFRWLENLGRKERIAQYTEDEIVELGSNAIGEIILFGLLSLIVVAEVSRQGDKKAKIQKIKEDEIINLVESVIEINYELEEIKKAIQKLQKSSAPYNFTPLDESHVEFHDDTEMVNEKIDVKKEFSLDSETQQ